MSNIENVVLERLNYDRLGNLIPFETPITTQIGEYGTVILNLKPNNPSEIKVYPNAKNGLYNASIQEYVYVEGNPLVSQFTYDANMSSLVFNKSEIGNHIMIKINAIGKTYMADVNIATEYDATNQVTKNLRNTIDDLNTLKISDNIIEGSNNLFMTSTEKNKLLNIDSTIIQYNGVERRIYNQGQIFYVAPNNEVIYGNDGLDINNPISLKDVEIILHTMRDNVGMLKGGWIFKLKEGIYTNDNSTNLLFVRNVLSYEDIVFEGEEVLLSETPKTILDGKINGASYTHGMYFQNMKIRIKNIKGVNFTEKDTHLVPTGTRGAFVLSGDKGSLYAINLHTYNCSWAGIVNQGIPRLFVEGGKFENCRFGVSSMFNTTVTIGYKGYENQNENEKTRFINCSEGGVAKQSQSCGHVDYSVFRNCKVGVFLATNSECNGVKNIFEDNVNAIWCETSSRFLNSGNIFIGETQQEYYSLFGGIIQESTEITEFRRRRNIESPNSGFSNYFVNTLSSSGILFEQDILARDLNGRGKTLMLDIYGRAMNRVENGCSIQIVIDNGIEETTLDTITPEIAIGKFTHFYYKVIFSNYNPNIFTLNRNFCLNESNVSYINSETGVLINSDSVIKVKIKCVLGDGCTVNTYRVIPSCII